MYKGTYLLSLHYTLEVAADVHVENVDGQVILFAHRGGREIHHLKSAGVDFVVGDVVELGGSGVFLRVGGVDAVNAGAFEHNVGFNLYSS